MEGILPAIIIAIICFFVMRKIGCCGGHSNSSSKAPSEGKNCCNDKNQSGK